MSSVSKRQKLEVEFFDPRIIPINVWDKIFQYCSLWKLKDISLVCKSFNEIFGNLPSIMDRTTLKLAGYYLKEPSKYSCFQKRNPEVILQSSRNYINIKYQSIENSDQIKLLVGIPEKFGSNLLFLEIKHCCLAKEQLIHIFEATHANLKTLKLQLIDFEDTQQSPGIEATPKQFKFSKLEDLKFDYRDFDLSEFLLDLLPDTIRRISFTCTNDNMDATNNSKILEMQKQLKYLLLDLCVEDKPLMEIIDGSKIQFQLETLEIFEYYVYPVKFGEKFVQFLESQESVKNLKIACRSIHKYYKMFENMPNLEKLYVEFRNIQKLNEGQTFNCPSLKKLTIYFPDFIDVSPCDSFIVQFSDLQDIEFLRRIKPKLLKKIISNLPNLKTLRLHKYADFVFKKCRFNNIQELVIEGECNREVEEYSEKRKMQKQKNKGKDKNFWGLFFGGNESDNSDSDEDDSDADSEKSSSDEEYQHDEYEIVMDNVFSAITNLKVLKISRGVSFTENNLISSLQNFKQLKHLEFSSPIKAEDLCKISHFFKYLNVLKIYNVRGPLNELKDRLNQFPDLQYFVTDEYDDGKDKEDCWDANYSHSDDEYPSFFENVSDED